MSNIQSLGQALFVSLLGCCLGDLILISEFLLADSLSVKLPSNESGLQNGKLECLLLLSIGWLERTTGDSWNLGLLTLRGGVGKQLLPADRLLSGHCCHLGSEAANGRFLLALLLSINQPVK